jgi:hypothetical protein
MDKNRLSRITSNALKVLKDEEERQGSGFDARKWGWVGLQN